MCMSDSVFMFFMSPCVHEFYLFTQYYGNYRFLYPVSVGLYLSFPMCMRFFLFKLYFDNITYLFACSICKNKF